MFNTNPKVSQNRSHAQDAWHQSAQERWKVPDSPICTSENLQNPDVHATDASNLVAYDRIQVHSGTSILYSQRRTVYPFWREIHNHDDETYMLF
jgi:hypothetical protein